MMFQSIVPQSRGVISPPDEQIVVTLLISARQSTFAFKASKHQSGANIVGPTNIEWQSDLLVLACHNSAQQVVNHCVLFTLTGCSLWVSCRGLWIGPTYPVESMSWDMVAMCSLKVVERKVCRCVAPQAHTRRKSSAGSHSLGYLTLNYNSVH